MALQHNLGLGGAVVVAMYKRPEQWADKKRKAGTPSGAMGLQKSRSKL